MLLRILPAALPLAAAVADADGAHRLAFYLLLAAIPAAAVTALERFGALVEGRGGAAAFLSGVALVLLVVSSATRSAAVTAGGPPALAATALAACLCVVALQVVLDLGGRLHRERARGVLRQVD